jgi:hypothetical protein
MGGGTLPHTVLQNRILKILKEEHRLRVFESRVLR